MDSSHITKEVNGIHEKGDLEERGAQGKRQHSLAFVSFDLPLGSFL